MVICDPSNRTEADLQKREDEREKSGRWKGWWLTEKRREGEVEGAEADREEK